MKTFYRRYILPSGRIVSETVQRMSYSDAILDLPVGAQFLKFQRLSKSLDK